MLVIVLKALPTLKLDDPEAPLRFVQPRAANRRSLRRAETAITAQSPAFTVRACWSSGTGAITSVTRALKSRGLVIAEVPPWRRKLTVATTNTAAGLLTPSSTSG